MGQVQFNKQNNRRKRTLPGYDHYTGLAFYSNTYPSGFDTQTTIITPEVKASATLTVTNKGANEDVAFLYVIDPIYNYVYIGSYKKIAGDDTTAKVATAIAAIYNQPGSIYPATVNGSVVSVHARNGMGASFNTAQLYVSYTNGATLAITSGNFSGGVDADTAQTPATPIKEIVSLESAEGLGITSDNASMLIKTLHYHISELFRFNPDAILFVGVFPEPAVDAEHTFNEVNQLRLFSGNKVRQIGVWTKKPYSTGQIALLQSQYTAAFSSISMFEILYSPNLFGVADNDMPDYSAATSPNVHTIIGQDGNALGKSLFTAAEFSIGTIGAALGVLSLSKVSDCIGWVERYNVAVDGGELDKPALSNGTLVSDLAENITRDEGILDTKRLIFLKKYSNITGTYFNDSHGCVKADDDYAYIEDNRTIDKAIRGIYTKLMPSVNGPTLFDKVTKKLRPETISFLQLQANTYLEEMERASELSGYSVTIDPDQDSYNTNQIEIDISNTAVGVSRRFLVNIGY